MKNHYATRLNNVSIKEKSDEFEDVRYIKLISTFDRLNKTTQINCESIEHLESKVTKLTDRYFERILNPDWRDHLAEKQEKDR